jgi:hypothetical protein
VLYKICHFRLYCHKSKMYNNVEVDVRSRNPFQRSDRSKKVG